MVVEEGSYIRLGEAPLVDGYIAFILFIVKVARELPLELRLG